MENIKHLFLLFALTLIFSCSDNNPVPEYPTTTRESKLPADITKQTPEEDDTPPVIYSDEYEKPVPVPGKINTSGAEDSPFILPDGKTLYFFFTPDVRIAPDKQLLDEVTGVWVSQQVDGIWQEARRIWLQEPGKLALDGAVAIQDDIMWFASAREGYTGVNIFNAKNVGGKWTDWQYCGDRLMKEIQIGECHPHGDTLYFHSAREGTKGDYDIWTTINKDGNWTDPINISVINTSGMDGFPFVSGDSKELWFTRTYQGTPAIYRSKKQNGHWGLPELIVSQFAGEPTLDDAGNLYFVHHYYKNDTMIEADIYVAKKK